ncbi:MAG: hypothetical protein QOH88_559 [Verrucomicrobiota bacterium]|jgi:hypothetical protein
MRRFPATARALLVLLCSAFLPAPADAEEQPETLGPLAIFDAALKQFEESRVALRKWQYHQTLTTQQVDSSGKVVAKGTWKSIVRPGDPGPLEYTSESMEGKLSFFKKGAEQSAPEKKTSSTPQPKTTGESEKNQMESAVDAVQKYDLRDRYLWKRLPDENAAGESAYVISFEPKPKQNTKSREERFFSLLAGKLWVSRNDFTLLKAEASLQSPCSLFWLIARVTTFQLNYELEPVRDGNRLLRISRATAKTVVSFPFYSIRQNHRQTVDKYEPRSPRASDASHAP